MSTPIEQFNNRGIVAMANSGPDSNKVSLTSSSHLVWVRSDLVSHRPNSLSLMRNNRISMASTQSLESKASLVFSAYIMLTFLRRVIDGADSTLDAMEKVPVGAKNRPVHEIKLNKVSQLCVPLFEILRLTRLTGHNPRQPVSRTTTMICIIGVIQFVTIISLQLPQP